LKPILKLIPFINEFKIVSLLASISTKDVPNSVKTVKD